MGIVFGTVSVEKPAFAVEKNFPTWQIRRYDPNVVVETSYKASVMDGKESSDAFRRLATYIGVFGTANNTSNANNNPETIAMTAPVLMTQKSEKIAMTAPVLSTQKNDNNNNSYFTMTFILPSKYRNIEETPLPNDPKVSLRQIPERLMAVTTFSGSCTPDVAAEKAKTLLKSIQEDNTYTFIPPENEKDLYYEVAQYNPPFTIPFLRTNEIMIPVSRSWDE